MEHLYMITLGYIRNKNPRKGEENKKTKSLIWWCIQWHTHSYKVQDTVNTQKEKSIKWSTKAGSLLKPKRQGEI